MERFVSTQLIKDVECALMDEPSKAGLVQQCKRRHFCTIDTPLPPTFRPCSLKCSSSQHPWHDAFVLRVLEFPNESRSVWSAVSTQLIKDVECALLMGEPSKAGLAEHKHELNTPHLPSTHARLKCSLIQRPSHDAFALRRVLESPNESRSVWSNWI